MRFLVIEPVRADLEAINSIFKMCWHGILIIAAHTGAEAWETIEKRLPDLIILDLTMPDIDSFEMVKSVRLFSSVPLIVIDANQNESSLVRSFELGADDYLIKPLRPLELLARTKSLMRRISTNRNDQILVAGMLRLHASLHMAYLGDKEVALTRTEHVILRHLVENMGNTVSHRSIAQKVWGDDSVDSSASLRVYIEHIRKKLGDNSRCPSLILTETGFGYRLIPPETRVNEPVMV
ncbi:response regulator transcription factor [Dehalogenimonas etheniformans]|uniref:DNA-binding response regulator n=1 Tax=Dehalogenimonas etheniformans TaxID=1536648 RepID=A0A2P5P6W9_9CHLR|nr:response regulator transcription factor [Dehalogenimonas etheniformans]PPD58051.1 DNA-binding response regulator [Dehalogenimonas etheniformans]QNT75402.1 response regulator transcription factor [Dehalogenimonas etheniformans]